MTLSDQSKDWEGVQRQQRHHGAGAELINRTACALREGADCCPVSVAEFLNTRKSNLEVLYIYPARTIAVRTCRW